MNRRAILAAAVAAPLLTLRSTSATEPGDRDVSVLDYVPSGVTPDGYHLQLALNDTPRVFVPYGVSLSVATEITVPAGRTLAIDGTLTAASNRATGFRVLRIHSAADVAIGGRGKVLAGTQVNTIYGAWVSGTTARLQLADLTISGFYSGVWSPTDGAWRDDCRADRLTVTGGYVGLSLASWRRGVVTDPNVSGFSHAGISTYNAAGIRITGGRVTNGGYTTSSSAAINLELAPDATVEGVTISDIEGHGIRVANKSHRAAIVGNNIANIGYLAGVITRGASTAITAMIGPAGGESQRLRIEGNTATTIAGYGILVHPGLSAIVRGNNLSDMGDPGIAFIGSGSIQDNTIDAADGPGIILGPDPDGGAFQSPLAIVTGNLVTNSGMAGILLNGSPLVGRVADNVLAGNADGVVSQNFGAFSPGAVVENNG